MRALGSIRKSLEAQSEFAFQMRLARFTADAEVTADVDDAEASISTDAESFNHSRYGRTGSARPNDRACMQPWL